MRRTRTTDGLRQAMGPVLVVTIICAGPTVLSPLGVAQPIPARGLIGQAPAGGGQVDRFTTAPNTTIVFSPLKNDRIIESSAILTSLRMRDPKTGKFTNRFTILGEGEYSVEQGRVSFKPYAKFRGQGTEIGYRAQAANGTTIAANFSIRVSEKFTAETTSISTQRNKSLTFSPVDSGDRARSGKKLLLIDPSDKRRKQSITLRGQGEFSADDTGRVTFVPASGFVGPVTQISYALADEPDALPTGRISLRVLPSAPVARDDEARFGQGESAVITVTANDTGEPEQEFDADSLELTDPVDRVVKKTVVIPDEGTYAVRPGARVLFTPNAGFSGTTRPLTYRISSDQGGRATARLRFTIAERPGPRLGADLANAVVGSAISVKPLANDFPGAAGAALAIGTLKLRHPETGELATELSLPKQGKVQLTADRIIFTPAAGFIGRTRGLSYVVQDESGQSARADLIFTVLTPPDPQPDQLRVPQGSSAKLDVLRNDRAGAAALQAKTLGLLGGSEPGPRRTLAIPGEGSYAITEQGEVEVTPLATFTGSATPVDYVISDALGAESSATISATVIPVVPSPVQDAAATPGDTPVTVDVLANDGAGNSENPLDPASVRLLDPVDGLFTTELNLTGQG
ncbi:MAG: Ig-like domain-containing protein, partial [Angustibacter sp.]